MTKNYSVRIANIELQKRITKYAQTHEIPESTAIVRLLGEGEKAAEGKPITRFAALDPGATQTLSLALGELRNLAVALAKCCSALERPRPIQPDEVPEWQKDKADARKAFEYSQEKIQQLKKAANLEFLLNDVRPEKLEKYYNQGVKAKGAMPEVVAVFGALLGKPMQIQTRIASTSGEQTSAKA